MPNVLRWVKTIVFLPTCLFAFLLLQSCVDNEERDDTPVGNFEALWHIIDEHYCFFDYKQQQYGLDWQQVYQKYRVRIDDNMTDMQLFEVCCNMLSELRDGHVNLYSSYDIGRYWTWHEAFPRNFSDSLYRRYMGTNYKIASALRYRVLDDNIGYVRCESFETPIGEGNLNDMLSYLSLCRGLIIDVRCNGGGSLTNAEMLAGRFVQEKTLVGYMQHKTGTGHNDFSSLESRYMEPSSKQRWHKPVCVLINRSVYSAANDFAVMMRAQPNVQLVGDNTGGGSGLPMSSSLPNGWGVRFSACPMYDANRQQTEFGIAPDVRVSLTADDEARGVDTMIETARKLLIK